MGEQVGNACIYKKFLLKTKLPKRLLGADGFLCTLHICALLNNFGQCFRICKTAFLHNSWDLICYFLVRNAPPSLYWFFERGRKLRSCDRALIRSMGFSPWRTLPFLVIKTEHNFNCGLFVVGSSMISSVSPWRPQIMIGSVHKVGGI